MRPPCSIYVPFHCRSSAGLIREAKKKGLLKEIKMDRKEVEVCMLQFVDDTLFLVKSKHHSILSLKSMLRCFELPRDFKLISIKVCVSDDILNMYA